MVHDLRAGLGVTVVAAFAGLTLAGPASAAVVSPSPSPSPSPSASASASASAPGSAPSSSPTPTPTTTTQICRYYVNADKPIPVKSGPGKQYATQGWVSPNREKPIFGTCAKPGTGPSHWVKVSQGSFKGKWIWRNWLDRD